MYSSSQPRLLHWYLYMAPLGVSTKKLIPVSIKLKSTLDTPKARQIIRKAEKSQKGNTRLQGQASFNHLARKVRTMPTFHQ